MGKETTYISCRPALGVHPAPAPFRTCAQTSVKDSDTSDSAVVLRFIILSGGLCTEDGQFSWLRAPDMAQGPYGMYHMVLMTCSIQDIHPTSSSIELNLTAELIWLSTPADNQCHCRRES